jgi:hypothetical protein
MTSDRTTQLRHALVVTAEAASFTPRRRVGPRVVAAIAAFALAGGLTGGAVAIAAAQGAIDQQEVADSGMISRHNTLDTHAVLIGSDYVVAGSGTTTINVGVMPDGATGLGVAVDCVDEGTYDLSIDGAWVWGGSCDGAQEALGSTGSIEKVGGDGTHVFSVSGTGAYILWAGWAKEDPAPGPSAELQSAMADGVVTKEEYVAGFYRYASCVEDHGWQISYVDDGSTFIGYSLVGDIDAVSEYTQCYLPLFGDIDNAWTLANPDDSFTTIQLQACLRNHGIIPSESAAEVDQQLIDAGIPFEDCY